jgi:hypothetical protein
MLTGAVGQEVKNCIQVFSGQLGCEVVELNIQQGHIHLIIQCATKGIHIAVYFHALFEGPGSIPLYRSRAK